MGISARPPSTYRLQLGERFTFDDARAALPYLDALGVGALYLSPILTSAGGDGYHVIDPTAIDPRLGGEEGFDRLAEAARARGLEILLDIVPNHLKASEESLWWADVLAKGKGSRYARWFDIDWKRHGGKILLPVLPEPGARKEDEHTIRTYWRDGLRELNYRRFFDIADLVCLRQENPEVFEATHATILRLLREGKATGLRVDHVDGLRDPQEYLVRLRAAAPNALLLVEKILAPGEQLPGGWPVDGTTGYEAGDLITGVLTDASGAAACDRLLERLSGLPPFHEVVVEAKREVLETLFAGEVARLVERFRPLADVPASDLRTALVEITANLRVYRTYLRDPAGPGLEDRARIEEAVNGARGAVPEAALDAVADVLLDPGAAGFDAVMDWQQLSGPAMAKGNEDTALYRHTALVSRNEVGGDPGEPPPSPRSFHAAVSRRSPVALTATSTHDSKRSEDVRARLAALSELADTWTELAPRWRERAPDGTLPEEDLLLFQTLLGAWPLDGEPDGKFVRRIQEAMIKSAREAKRATSWLDPDERHEQALWSAVAVLVRDPRFLETFVPLQERVAVGGAVHGLAQLVLKAVVPGIPDVYQGGELWHLRLVDPDNRGPVDLALRAMMLEELDGRRDELPALADELLDSWRDGRVKLLVSAAALRLRRAQPSLFEQGDYLPLYAEGEHAERVVAAARRLGQAWAAAVVPRLSSTAWGGAWPIGDAWGDTRIRLPADAPRTWSDAIARHRVEAGGGSLPLEAAHRHLPVALLTSA